MKTTKTTLRSLLIASAAATACLPVQAAITFISGEAIANGGEIVSFSGGALLTTDSLAANSHGVQSYTINSSGSLVTGLRTNLVGAVGATAADINSISSVLADSRGFGVATVIPTATATTTPGQLGPVGRIAFFNLSIGSLLHTLDVGYHPDSVSITPDGSKLLIANEGEFVSTAVDTTAGNARPGSVSVVNISSITGGNFTTAIPALTSGAVATYDFSAANLGSGVNLSETRNNRLDTLTSKNPNAADIEPEYITASNTTAYISLQEANAIATLDLASGKYTNISSFGTITQTIDASDLDGVNINDTVVGLPMPDTIAKFERGGATYIVTANEGDARPDDGDIGRVNSGGSTLIASIDVTDNGSGDQIFTGSTNTTSGIGKLNILKDVGNSDADGLIEVPTMLGTRSFSIWNASTGALAFDSGSMIEQFVATYNPASFNMNNGSTGNVDTRSDDKGPEPEGLAFASFSGRDFVFVGNERENGIFQFDITDLNSVFIAGYFNPVTGTTDGALGGVYFSPESIIFIAAADNPTGKNLIVVGFEGTGGNGSVGVFEVTATSAIPEPSSAAAMAGAALLGMAVFRRRRSAR
ncbi:MAG: choice-of-anchor I family protein [Verrucomicrobia bacterium]|nr:choice-of-anchor I family protein [Verrucomicrobiota bacterium]